MIETYDDLKASVIGRISNEKVAGVVAECIQLAESRMRNDLLIRRMERSEHGTFDGAVIFLPDDCEQIQRLMYYIGDKEFSVPFADPKSVERLTGTSGDPKAYTMKDQAIVLYPTPESAREYTLDYVPFIADLSDTNPSNWILDRAPDVYLWATCVEAANYLHDDMLEAKFNAKYTAARDALFSASERQRTPSNTPIVARPYRAV